MTEKTTHLKYFGIGKILLFLRHVRKLIVIMVVFGLVSSVTDIILPWTVSWGLGPLIPCLPF